MVSFSQKEVEFLNGIEECRIATSHANIPHVKPVSYLYEEGIIWIATDYDTRMYKNLQKNPKVALTIDVYKEGGHKAVCIQGSALILESGTEFSTIYEKFYEKFSWVRNDPWGENEAPIIQIVPYHKSSWGIK